MHKRLWSSQALAAAVFLSVVGAGVRAADPVTANASNASGTDDAQIKALESRIADLESKENQNWMTDERAAQIRGIVEDVLKDAKYHSQYADGAEVGYKDGFFIQTPDQNFKLVIGGFGQFRYEFSQANAYNKRTLPANTVGTSSITPHDPGNASGFDIRRARLSASGNIFSPDLTFKLEGDFYGGGYVNSINTSATNLSSVSSGAFTVTDAFVAYRFNDQFKLRLGSFKIPFSKAELTSDTAGEFQERPEVNAPFDPVRSIGLSLYGDIVKDKLGYEVNMDDGGSTFDGANANTDRRDATTGNINNLGNRPSFYGRIQWAGAGKISDFADEPDLRQDNHDFIWMLGAAAGYDSQNNTNNAFPSPQGTTSVIGISSTGAGFAKNYVLNGDIYRGTIDWSAKYQGFSFTSAGYFQQVNANTGDSSATSTTPSTGPFGTTDASFFQWGGYGQVGYFVIPQKLELLGRIGYMGTEGYKNIGEFYSVGADYYVFGHNFKIQSDVTFTPEAAYTDAAASLLQNTHDVIARVQVQLKF